MKSRPDGAYASVNARSTGGYVTGRASATSRVYEDAKSSIVKAILDAVHEVKGGKRAHAVAHGTGEAIAYAIAKSYTSAYTHTYSSGKGGSVCARAYASGDAVAHGYAKAYVDAVTYAKNKYGHSLGVSKASSIAGATARAFSKAEAKACTYGRGQATAFQESVASAITAAYVKAVVYAISGVTRDGKPYSYTKAGTVSHTHKDTDSKTKSYTHAEGDYSHADARGKAEGELFRHRECRYTRLASCCARHDPYYGYPSYHRRRPRRCRAKKIEKDHLIFYKSGRLTCYCG